MRHLVAWVLTASRVEFQETNSDFHCIVIISSSPYSMHTCSDYNLVQKCWPCKNGWQVSKIWEMFIILELWIHSIPLYSCISHCPCVWDLTFRFLWVADLGVSRELRRHTGNRHARIVRYGLMCLWYHTNILFIPRTIFFNDQSQNLIQGFVWTGRAFGCLMFTCCWWILLV